MSKQKQWMRKDISKMQKQFQTFAELIDTSKIYFCDNFFLDMEKFFGSGTHESPIFSQTLTVHFEIF